MKKKFQQAFSLVEVSIVILIIGIVIAAITSGSKMINKAKIVNAQLSTKNSGIDQIPNMLVWYETTLKESLVGANASRIIPENGDNISLWKDLNPTTTKYNLSQSTSANQPSYNTGVINGLPALKFNGSSSNFQLTNLCGYNFSVFVVIQTTNAGAGLSTGYPYEGSGILYADSSSNANDSIPLAIAAGKLKFGVGDVGGLYITLTSSASYNDGKPHIATMSRIMNSGAMTFYVDGISAGTGTGSTNVLLYNGTITIGGNPLDSKYYNGYIGEIIIYNRYLQTNERKIVESYLGKKWGVTVN